MAERQEADVFFSSVLPPTIDLCLSSLERLRHRFKQKIREALPLSAWDSHGTSQVQSMTFY